ncbi:response regulator [Albimonas pacifica]|uniref:Response regulator receiver domain-containing protein n=1 Tax=Albimonas pacifica TaxID=1114924 RepID=A0A1I3FLK5_9RHOB|nr:response regulator [Albimonas pacifica]SFI12115.1 Response regulator receiver domain-containing protein [Albimonas pacifica]
MRCLIVEDDTSLAELVRLEIGDHDVEGVCMPSIAAAIAAMKEAPPDALVIDLTLPDGCGLEVAAEARRLCPQAPALIFTGSEEADALAIFRSHANVRAVVAKRVEDGDEVGALARSLASMIRGSDAPCPGLARGFPGGTGRAGPSPELQARRAAMQATLRKAAEGRPPATPLRPVRPAASSEGRPRPPRLRA